MYALAAEVARIVKVSNLSQICCALMRAWNVQEDPSITRDVFLYCKAHLRSGATLPTPQQLTPFKIDGKRAASPTAHGQQVLAG